MATPGKLAEQSTEEILPAVPHGPVAVHRRTIGTTDINLDGPTGGDTCLDILDGRIWNTFREHLGLELEPIAAKLV
jgi:hypothetical protein